MADILEFPPVDLVAWGRDLRKARVKAELSLNQAAVALEISPTTLDAWEQGRKPQVAVEAAAERFDAFRKSTEEVWRTGENLIFGVFPLRVARDVLGWSIDEIATEFSYSRSSWTKMEANARLLPKEAMDRLQDMVGAAWSDACARSERLR